MKVILKSDVSNVGRAGDILEVKSGYARNYLFPRKLALSANAQSAKERSHKKKLAELRAKKAQSLRDEIAKKLEGHKISFQKPTTAQGKLFGSVTAFEIAQRLKKEGFLIDKKFLNLKEPIKNIGEYPLKVDLGKESQATITVHVQDEKLAKTKKPSLLSKIVGLSKSKDSKTKDSEKTAKDS